MSDDISIDEKRVYGDKEGTTTAFVATGVGLARVDVSDDIVGEFSLLYQGPATDVTTAEGRLAIATPEDVLVGTDDGFETTGFGPATAVGYEDGLLAAGEGCVSRYDEGWRTLTELEDVRAIDGELLAAAAGIHRLDGTHVGLEAAHDVTTAGGPLAATESGLYYLANGWMDASDGDFRLVASRTDGTAHAGTRETLYERTENGWSALELPVEGTVADVAYSEGATYAVMTDGTFLVNAGDGWRHRSLGLPDATAITVA
jgi:hypothetical protein